jgi:amidohydrolase
MDIAGIKAAVAGDIDSGYQKLGELSRKLHDNPETAMEEHKAMAWLTDYLEKSGFSVERGICDLPTAFRAKYGKGKPSIAFLAEYDALPKIGHACGHNLIAASAVAAGVAAQKAVDEFGGCVTVYGTPGEELAGGKALMADRGAFKELDVAMISHPGGGHHIIMNALACQNLYIEFFGRAAHAAAEPETGINALAAMILSYNAIDALRQHIKETSRIHGVITDGGEAANIVPAHTAATFMVRAVEDKYLDELKEKVIGCFTGAARATGAELKYRWDEVRYAAMKNNLNLARLFQKNMKAVGCNIPIGEGAVSGGSTDVGNVSQLIPAIHPMVGITRDSLSVHTAEFAKATATEEALRRMLEAAGAMAMTAADLLADPALLKKVKVEFEKGKT